MTNVGACGGHMESKGDGMRITLLDGTVMDRPFAPENCTGYEAASIEISSDDFIAMAAFAGRDLGEFQAAMRQLSARLPGGQLRTETADSIHLVRTCEAFPEAYDAFIGDKQVGYLRLRHGIFRVDVPDAGGTTVLMTHPEGDGMFDDGERERYLEMAKDAIADAVHASPDDENT